MNNVLVKWFYSSVLFSSAHPANQNGLLALARNVQPHRNGYFYVSHYSLVTPKHDVLRTSFGSEFRVRITRHCREKSSLQRHGESNG